MKNYESLVDALADLKSRGYKENFEAKPYCLYCGDLDIRMYPQDFKIDEVYRFEGDSNPDDNSVLYAISSSTGIKGTMVDAFGAYSENMGFEMAKKMREDEIQIY